MAPVTGLAAGSNHEGDTGPNPFRELAASRTLESTAAGRCCRWSPVNRPAEAITMLGFIYSEVGSDPDLTAVARSWEQRFAAVVTTIGPGTLGLAVGRPPGDADQALALAAEQDAFAPEQRRRRRPTLAQALRADGPGDRARGFWAFGWPD